MRVAIVGSRDANILTLQKVREYVNSLPPDTVVVSGGARGVDKVAETTALERGLEVIVHTPNWDKYGRKQAGFKRNALIVADAHYVAAFWDGHSRGTKNTIELALNAPHIIRVTVYKEVNT